MFPLVTRAHQHFVCGYHKHEHQSSAMDAVRENLRDGFDTPYESPKLPPEVFGMVMGHLHHDKKTIAACSLAASSFLPPSRYHLFYTLSIRPRYDKGPCMERIPFNNFRWFIRENLHLSHYIRQLHLIGGEYERPSPRSVRLS